MYYAMQMEVSSESGNPVVKFTIDGRTSVLGVSDIDQLVMQLSYARAAMQPTHPIEPPEGQYMLQVDPCWRIDRMSSFDGAVLSMRHVGVGWIAFALPTANMTNLISALAGDPEPMPSTNHMMLN